MYLGIDLGTSGVKSLLIDDNQHIVGSTQASLEVSRPHSGWSEQDPLEWIKATETTLDTLAKSHPSAFRAVKGISLSGQMHGATLLDASGTPLRPCMLWNDTRSALEAAELDANPAFREISGNIVFPGFTAPKLCWVAKHEPEIFTKTAKVLLPKDFLRLWLTGEYVSEMSDAAGTSWLDVKQRDWSQTLLDASGVRLDQMPSLIEGTEVSGELRSELVARWQFDATPIVGGGAGDNAASACGLGVITEGQAFLSLGTSGVLFAATDGYNPNAESAVHAFCHALPNTWHQMGVILSATDALNWYSRLTGKSAKHLAEELRNDPQGPSKVTFLPYLSGERTPHNDASIRGAFLGIDHQSDQASLTQAVMEGVSFAIRDNLEALRQAGTHLQSVMAVGGGTGSEFWLQTLANTLNLPVDLPNDGDFGGAFGAARLAMIAATGSAPETILQVPTIRKTFTPNTALVSAYEEAYQRYRRAYPAIHAL